MTDLLIALAVVLELATLYVVWKLPERVSRWIRHDFDVREKQDRDRKGRFVRGDFDATLD